MESNEKIGYCRYVVPHEKDNSINSNAIMKQTTVMCAKFSKLECNTNLHLPPSNWLTNDSYGLRSCLSPSKGFSSFRMAHMFPDCLGGIDVVSGAENIKNLLKLPYSLKSTISLMVHRVENTLLIDDFDLYKFLLQQAEDDWKWLRTFIIEALSPKDRSLLLKNYCSKENFEQKKLWSKFLYHSLLTDDLSNDDTTHNVHAVSSTILQQIRSGPLLPEPSVDENIPESGDHIFNRNVVWTFEDIRMLIGTDMPIFGGQTQPCISLKLRDMSKPINILTGIDYWLDNLMCNVPEVVMCYHLDGLVQKYELIKTEDLPYLENSNFSPKVIRNVAQNILSFLKRNATKAGHTYWLFKGSNDDFVKLYDLTSLCRNTEQAEPERNSTETTNLENPFTVPVAMLLYKVAKNMKSMTENMTAKQAGSIKALLDNCIQLLPKEKYPQIVTSSHYMLSDLLLPADIDPSSPILYPNNGQEAQHRGDKSNLSENDTASDPDESNNSDEITLKTVIESNLEKNWKHNSSPPPITDDVKKRCMLALRHIAEGLSCLQFFSETEEKEKRELNKENEKRKIILEELNQKMAEPCIPIPLPYETLKPEARQINSTKAIPMGWKTDSITPSMASPTATANRKNKKKKKKTKKQTNVDDRKEDGRSLLLKGKSGVIQSWNVHLKLLLLEKACLTYATLAEQFYDELNFGKTLRFILMALNCQKIVAKYMNSISDQTVCLMGRAGDCFFQIATNADHMATSREAFYRYSKTDLAISQELQKEEEFSDIFDLEENLDDLLYTSLKCYKSALDLLEPKDDKRRELVRRIGSVHNEIGVRCMHRAQDEYAKTRAEQADNPIPNDDTEPLYQTLTRRSYSNLLYGIEAFEEIKDEANLAILLCNMGRYYRFRASIYLPGDDNKVELKKLYENAFLHYNRALGIVGSRKENLELWDILTWELSTSTFTWAQIVMSNTGEFLQDDENSSKLIELWQKALKGCDTRTVGPRLALYQYRKALIHGRMGHIFFELYLKHRSAKRVHSQLCHLHDDKAMKLMKEVGSSLSDFNECLTFHLRQMELHSLCADDFFKGVARIESLRLSLSYALGAKFIFQLYINDVENVTDQMTERMESFEKSLQSILKKALQISMKTSAANMTNLFKTLYALALRKPEKLTALQMATHLLQLLDKKVNLPDEEP